MRAVIAAAVVAAAAIGAQAAPASYEFEAGVADRTLRERTSSGVQLLRENGPLAQVQGTMLLAPADRPLYTLHARLAAGRLNYDGQTQGGEPLRTHSTHNEIELGAGWRPWAPAAWGQLELGLDQLHFHRDIASTATVQGLVEASNITFAALTWRSPDWRPEGSTFGWHLEARARTSLLHRLQVDYGGFFDGSSLDGGRRDELTLRAAMDMPSGWTLALAWQRARQNASETSDLTRAGVQAGTVQQPRLDIDDLQLSLRHSF